MTPPVEYLLIFLQELITIKLKNGEEICGILEGVDEHINIMVSVQDKLMFIRGENISFVAN